MRGRSSRTWLRERRRDQYYRRAKAEGYRSRSSYKLLEIAQKKRFIKPGFKVVDLGAAPGGWLQAAHRLVGGQGRLIGVDISPIKPLGYRNLTTILMDIENPDLPKIISNIAKGEVDAVLSDVAPDITGIWELDHARQIGLAQRTLEIAASTLRKGGSLFVKLFQGPEANRYVDSVRKYFSTVSYEKPKASRPSSAEMYVLALGFKGSPSE